MTCCVVWGQASANQKLLIDGSTGVKPLIEALIAEYQNTAQVPLITIGKGLNPQKRIQALIDQDIDIAMASHGIDIEQISKLGLTVHHIAKVAVVIGVNDSVKINDINHQQLCEIYQGKLDNWQLLGGDKQIIHPFIRPFSEVDTEVIAAHIHCFTESSISTKIPEMAKSGQMARALSQTSGAIGMTTQVRVSQSSGQIKALAINGVKPSVNNLSSGAYPFTRDSFLIAPKQPSQAVLAFLTFIRSDNGALVITRNDAIPAK